VKAWVTRAAWVAVIMWVATLSGAELGWAQQPFQGKPGNTGPSRQAPKPRAGDATSKPGDDRNAPVTVDADQLENIQKEGLIVFTGNVVANQDRSTQYADRMEVYLDARGESIVRTVSTGNVRIITKDCRMGTAQRAEYYDAEQRVVLIGDARVWQDENVVTGDRITIFLAEDRSVVEAGPQGRVKGVFYPKREGEGATVATRPAPGTTCKQS
jgi:lipopolysaccharide export system protein LptA